MANVLAAATGNWSSTSTWVGGALPAADDVVMANGFTVTINQNITVVQLRTDTTGGATAGGGFSVVNANGVTRTINASLFNANLTINNTVAGGTVSIIGDVTNSIQTSGSGASTISITGNWTISGSTQWFTANNLTINVTGNVTSTCTGTTGAVVNNGTGLTVNVTGNITNNSSNCPVFNGFTILTITVTGTVTGGGAAGININGGAATIVGSAVGGTSGAGITVNGGVAFVTRAVGGVAAVGVAAGNGVAHVEEIEYGVIGASPTSGPIRLTDRTNNKCLFFRSGLSKKTVSDIAGLGVLPAIADVRSGVSYNAGQLTGTCAVPAPSLVAAGAAVDDTTGTAAITGASIASACADALTAFASGRLSEVATTATTGQQIADATF